MSMPKSCDRTFDNYQQAQVEISLEFSNISSADNFLNNLPSSKLPFDKPPRNLNARLLCSNIQQLNNYPSSSTNDKLFWQVSTTTQELQLNSMKPEPIKFQKMPNNTQRDLKFQAKKEIPQFKHEIKSNPIIQQESSIEQIREDDIEISLSEERKDKTQTHMNAQSIEKHLIDEVRDIYGSMTSHGNLYRSMSGEMKLQLEDRKSHQNSSGNFLIQQIEIGPESSFKHSNSCFQKIKAEPDSALSKQEDQEINHLIESEHEQSKETQNQQNQPKLEESISSLGFAKTSLCFFSENNLIRKKIFLIVQSGYFENGMIAVIFANSVTLACYDYSDRYSKTRNNQIIDQVNLAFTAIFVIEAVLRIIATGLIMHFNAYLRSGWNLIDAAVVISGLLEIAFGTMNLKSLRVVRAFRPLKTINTIKSMKKLIQALIQSIPDFANVALFLLYAFLLFATLGLHEYNGSFYNACRYSPDAPKSPDEEWLADTSLERVCSISGLGSYTCPSGQFCRNPSDSPNYDYNLENMDDRWYVNYGITNFDNLGRALLTVFQIVTSDTWFQQLCNLLDTDLPIFGALYVISLIIIGQFFLMNLILAVIIFAFVKSQKESLQLEVAEYHKQERERNQINVEEHQGSPEDIVVAALVQQASLDEGGSAASHDNEEKQFQTFLKSKAKKRMVVDMFNQAKNLNGNLKLKLPNMPQEQSEVESKKAVQFAEEQQPKVENQGAEPQNRSKLMQRLMHKSGSPSEEQRSKERQKAQSQAAVGETLFQKIFKQYIEKKIEQEYADYFKTILKEAAAQETSKMKSNQNCNMREVVGIKVGLEYMRQIQLAKERTLEDKRNQNDRKAKSKLYFYAQVLHDHRVFQWFIILTIISNTLVLSLDQYPPHLEQIKVSEKLNYVFTAIFVLEIAVKLVAYGLKNFFKGSWFNFFDLIIVIASLVDIIVTKTFLNTNNKYSGSVITALRGFRLLRVFKLARSWKRFELLLDTMGSTLKDVATFSIILFLFIFIFSLLGMELFAYKAKLDPDTNYVDLENGESPTFNFDTFMNSFSLVFIILTNDGTSAIYYNHWRAVGALPATLFFVTLVLVGQKIILNLFVAILLQNFDEGVLKQKMSDYEEKQRGVMAVASTALMAKISPIERVKQYLSARARGCFGWVQGLRLWSIKTEQRQPIVLRLGLKQSEKKTGKKRLQESQIKQEHEEITLEGRPLLIIPSDFFLREVFGHIIHNRYYDKFLMLIIIVSVIQLALDKPLIDPRSYYAKTLDYIDILTTSIFIIEALLKIITFGFVFNGSQSYLKSTWNKLDFLIILFSILALTPLPQDLKAFKVLRIFRLISRNTGLQAAVKALLLGMPNIFNVTIIMLLFFLIFGVISVSQFKGLFYYCSDNQETPSPLLSKWDCLDSGGEWVNQIYTFDDIPNAMVTLFVMATTAGWQDVLINSVTSTSIDYIAHDQRSTFWTLFYILFMIIGFFFFLNLFVGVVVTNFQAEKDKIGGNDLLTEQQREWIDLKLLALRAAPIRKIMPPKNKLRLLFFKLEQSAWFENFIFISISLNSILLMFKWYQQSERLVEILEIINYVFTSIFTLEALLKIIGYGPRVFFLDNWNTFDFIVAIVSVVGIIIDKFSSGIHIKGTITLLRSLRILRIVRLLKRGGKSLHMIFNTFVICIQSLVNIGALLLLIIYMYSVLGMILFGSNMRTGLMNNWMNFEDFFNSFLILFTVTTGDSWNAFQTSFVVYPSPQQQCIWNPSYQDYLDAGGVTVGCSSKPLAYAFFVSYYFIVSLIFLQLFIAVILQGYDDTQVQESRLFNNDMNTAFRQAWSDYDPEATTFINLCDLRPFLERLGTPLGFDPDHHSSRYDQDKFIASLDLPTYFDFQKYQYMDVLDALSFRLMVIDNLTKKDAAPLNRKDSVVEKKMHTQLEKEVNKLLYQTTNEGITAVQELFAREFRQTHRKGRDKDGLTSSHHMAAEAAVRKWKKHKARRGDCSSKMRQVKKGKDEKRGSEELRCYGKMQWQEFLK